MSAHTEEEAKAKVICPMKFARIGSYEFSGNCIGSPCGAWRWVQQVGHEGDGNWQPIASENGYCGLAGEP